MKKITNDMLLMLTKLKKIMSKKIEIDSNITPSDYIFLLPIKEYGKIDDESGLKIINTSSLSEKLDMSKPALAKETKRLEKLGYLKKTIKLLDLRNRYIILTEKGNNKLEDDYDKIYNLPSIVVEKLGEEESQEFIDLLNKVFKILSEVKKKGVNI